MQIEMVKAIRLGMLIKSRENCNLGQGRDPSSKMRNLIEKSISYFYYTVYIADVLLNLGKKIMERYIFGLF